MVRTILSLICISISSIIYAQGIEFYKDSWESALAEAKKKDKIIFVDAYAKWCGPCKRMAREVFTQEKVGSFFNDNFINMKIDMEEPEGYGFGKNYPVRAFPTLFFIDSDGNILKKVVGGKQADDLISLGKQAIRSWDRSGQYAERYEAGERDFDLMLNYVRELNKVAKPSLKISNDYLNSKPNISDAQKAEFLMVAVQESDSKLYEQLLELKDHAIAVSGKNDFEDKVSEACLITVQKAVEFEYPGLLEEAIHSFRSASIGDAKQFEAEARLLYHALLGEFDLWKEQSKKFLKKYGKKNPAAYKEHLTQIMKYFSYSIEAKNYYGEIMELLIKHEATAENYMLFIRSLMNDRQYEKALEYCNEAIKKFKDSPQYDQLNQMQDYLKKMANI